jgi:hypothetical protein
MPILVGERLDLLPAVNGVGFLRVGDSCRACATGGKIPTINGGTPVCGFLFGRMTTVLPPMVVPLEALE